MSPTVAILGVFALFLAGLLGNMDGYARGFSAARRIYDQPTIPCPNVTLEEDCHAAADAKCERHQGPGHMAFTWCGKAAQ